MSPGRTAILWVAAFGIGWIFPGSPDSAADPMRAPKEVLEARKGPPADRSVSWAQGAVRFFRHTISPVDGDRCPMFPTCSQFGEQAVQRHGSILGLLLFVDRLFHEWSETDRAPRIKVYGSFRFWDPLDANDFWLPRGTGRQDAAVTPTGQP